MRPSETYSRQDPFAGGAKDDNACSFVEPTDLEWMSLNYRKERANKMSESKRRMVLVMFEVDYKYFPSPREIIDGVVKAQLDKIESNFHSDTERRNLKVLNAIKANYGRTWKKLFHLSNIGHIDKPLAPEVLANPNSEITKQILYLYSMECFIYPDLNRASRTKDKSKIKYYGAFAAALSYVIYFANANRKTEKLNKTTTLFRGLKVDRDEAESYSPGSKINLMGYVSTSE